MNTGLSDLSINRPVLATVLAILIVILGIAGYLQLPVREFPSVERPVITVQTNYPGANANIMESQITEPLEEAINSVEDIKTLTSVSSDGRSNITIEFSSKVDLSDAANNVRDKVFAAIRYLPPEAEPPVVIKADPDATNILTIIMQSDKRSLAELSVIGERTLKEQLQTIPGVSNVEISGEKRYAMRIVLSPQKMFAFEITTQDIQQALASQNIELPSGRIEGSQNEYTLRTLGQLRTPEEFQDVILRKSNTGFVRLSDVAEVRLGVENERTILRGNGVIPMIGIGLKAQPGANHIDIVDEAFRRVGIYQKDLPEDIQLSVSIDTTVPIRKALNEVKETILIAFCLVVIVIFLFLGNLRTTLIPVVIIPVSLVGSFSILYLSGSSINILSLLGLVLATGLVVDDAIVVMENIYSRIEKGVKPMEAAKIGPAEVYFAVISTSATLICVFLPIFFISGITGELFREFAIVVVSTIIISTFITLSLTPMMCSKILKVGSRKFAFLSFFENGVNFLSDKYTHSLAWFLKRSWLSVPLMIFSIVIIFILGAKIPGELAPLEDKSKLRYNFIAPEGTSFEAMDNYHMQILNLLDTLPEKVYLFGMTARTFGSSSSVNNSYASTTLVEPHKRNRSQQQIADDMQAIINTLSFAKGNVTQDPTISTGQRGTALPVQFIIQAPDIERLRSILPEFMSKVDQHPAVATSTVDLKFSKPELQIDIDREKSLAMGVSIEDIAATIQTYFGEQRLGYFIKDGKQYFILSEVDKKFRESPEDIYYLSVRNDAGQMITLDNLVSLETISRPPSLLRYNRYTAATVGIGLAPGIKLSEGIDAVYSVAREVLDDRFSTALAGSAADFQESNQGTYSIFIFAIILVYLTLAAQFESFKDPLIIMFTIPLALAGAVLSLYLFGHTLNIFSQIGMIVLIGIVTKNAILIIEFANQYKDRGYLRKNAVFEAASRRFRPILMTTLSTALGALPIALALGGASTSRIPMGIAIIGGLLYALVLTLYLIPAIYIQMSSKREKEHYQAFSIK
ncbi:efflux RND transporter permease subunit [Aquiflexum sp.]|uniref:efflux RND transporter permease subunit n=1 Tax=Aquiflexum sp. TaxID=1872584 RepID=UPI003593F66E